MIHPHLHAQETDHEHELDVDPGRSRSPIGLVYLDDLLPRRSRSIAFVDDVGRVTAVLALVVAAALLLVGMIVGAAENAADAIADHRGFERGEDRGLTLVWQESSSFGLLPTYDVRVRSGELVVANLHFGTLWSLPIRSRDASIVRYVPREHAYIPKLAADALVNRLVPSLFMLAFGVAFGAFLVVLALPKWRAVRERRALARTARLAMAGVPVLAKLPAWTGAPNARVETGETAAFVVEAAGQRVGLVAIDDYRRRFAIVAFDGFPFAWTRRERAAIRESIQRRLSGGGS